MKHVLHIALCLLLPALFLLLTPDLLPFAIGDWFIESLKGVGGSIGGFVGSAIIQIFWALHAFFSFFAPFAWTIPLFLTFYIVYATHTALAPAASLLKRCAFALCALLSVGATWKMINTFQTDLTYVLLLTLVLFVASIFVKSLSMDKPDEKEVNSFILFLVMGAAMAALVFLSEEVAFNDGMKDYTTLTASEQAALDSKARSKIASTSNSRAKAGYTWLMDEAPYQKGLAALDKNHFYVDDPHPDRVYDLACWRDSEGQIKTKIISKDRSSLPDHLAARACSIQSEKF